MIKISPDQLEMLKRFQKERDEYATMLGVATAEFEEAKSLFFKKLRASEDRQKNVGVSILKSLGLDPDLGDYIICLHGHTPGINDCEDGVVKKLVDGKYVDVGD